MKRFLQKGMLFIAALAFGTTLNAQTYCAYTTSTMGDYISSFSTSGGFPDIINNNTGQGPNGYSDYTTMIVGGYETQTIGFTITTGGGTYGYSIYIDWDNDFTFSAAEKVFGTSSYSPTPYTGSFVVPTGQAVGNYRMRVIADWLNGAPGPCSGSYAEAEDYTFQVITPPTCLPAQNLAVSNVTNTSLNFGWTEINSATQWQVDYGPIGFTHVGGNLQSNVVTNPYAATIVQGNEYDFYVRSICGVGDTSLWAGPFQFKYCDVSSQYTSEYLSVVNSSGALVDVNYTASSFPNGSYANETAQTFEAFETQTFDVNTTYSSGSSGVNIWVDWNKDMVFDASEKVAGSTSSVVSHTLPVTVPVGTLPGEYRMRVRGQWSSQNPPACGQITWGSTVDFNLTIVAPPTCLPPTNDGVTNVTDVSVDLNWTENGSATTWNIEWGPAGFALGSGNQINGVTSNPYSLTGLTSSTNYEFYVQSDCGGGDISYWSASSGSFLTECGIYEANGFCEGFDINLSPTIGCWRVRDANQDGDAWMVSTQKPNTGAYSAIFYSDGNNGNNDDYLMTPPLNMTGIEAMKFSYSVQSANEPNDFQVLLSTTGNAAADFTDTLMHLAQYSNTDYLDTVVDLTAYTGVVYIAFHIPPGGLDGWNLFIDDVCFGECIPTPGQDGVIDVCGLDGLVDLSDNIISHNNSYGYWEFPANQGLIVDDTMFNVGMMSEGSHEVLYIVQGLCEKDTTIATINVYPPSSAGVDGVMTVCKNTPTNLFSALSGNIDMGGTWYDPANNALPNSQPNAPAIPGMYQFTYITSNGFCPGDTSIVTVTVDGTCDNLSLGDDVLMDVSVYPNPATSVLTVVNASNSTSLKIEMLDMNGRVVLVEDKALNNATEATLSIDHIERGIYTLRVYNYEGQKTFKIVKQ